MDLEDALRDARRTAAEIAADKAEPQRIAREQRRREEQLIEQALEHLRPLGSDRFVVVDRAAHCEGSPAFRDADRFRGADGELWRVVEDYPCWVVGDDPADLDHLWLLLDEGRIGKFANTGALTRLDPRQGGPRGREFVSTLPLAPGFWTAVDEQILAWTIVRHEQAR